MNTRYLSTGLLLASCLACAQCSPGAASGRPNILLIVVDTLRADHLPFDGYARDTAPFLDELARRSVVFERAWSSSSWTCPATASLFTGVLPTQHGVYVSMTGLLKAELQTVRVNRIPSDLETIPELLQGLGYRTFALTDNPNVTREMGFASGFDRFQNFDYDGAARMNKELAAWREEIQGSSPWFLYLHYMDPHLPYHRRKPWFVEPPADAPEMQKQLAAYDSEIAYVDAHIEKAFALLGVDDETLVIFTADHGEEFGDHGGRNHLFQVYSELTRIPLLIRQPGVEPRRLRVETNVSLLDILPTLRAILGEPHSSQDAGRDLRACYLGETPSEERAILGHRRGYDAANEKEFVVRGDYKLIVTRPQERCELYDLSSDPGELHDIAAERPGLVAQLVDELARFHGSAPRWEREFTEVEIERKEVERLRELGYAGETPEGGQR